MPSEIDIQNAIRIAATNAGARMFRNNVGVLKDARGNRIAYGLCPGSSDLIGWTPQTIDGQELAIFTAIEVKRPGQKARPHQQRFIDQVIAAGGRAGTAHSVEAAREILGL